MSTFDPYSMMMLGGGLLGGLGSVLGGQAAGREGRLARDQYGSRTMEGMNRLGMMFYGPSSFMDFLGGTDVDYGGNFRPAALEGALQHGQRPEGMSDDQWSKIQLEWDNWKRMGQFVDQAGGPLLQQLRGLGDLGQQGNNQLMSAYNANTKMLMDQSGGIQSQARQMFGQNTQALSGLGQGAENIASNYGAGAMGVIDQDFDRSANDISDRVMAQLRASGMGGSTSGIGSLTRALSQNEAERSRAKTGVQMDTADRVLAARGQHMGTMASQFGQQQSVLPQLAGSGLSMLSGRLGGQTDLMRQNQMLGLDLAQLPINAILGIQQGSVMNPWLNQNTSQYYTGSGLGGLGQGLGQIGQGMSSFGAYGYGQNQQLAMLQKLMGGG